LSANSAAYLDVADILESFVEGRGGRWDWDAYITTMVFKDAFLQEVQNRMVHLSDEFPAEKGMGYCSPEGIQVIRDYAKQLRNKASEAEA
jgi:hypothetical protein